MGNLVDSRGESAVKELVTMVKQVECFKKKKKKTSISSNTVYQKKGKGSTLCITTKDKCSIAENEGS